MADCHPERPHWARGFCGTCYQRWWNEQNPGRTRERIKNRNNPATCHPEKQELARGLCGTCYRRQWRLANPGAEWERQNVAQKRKYAASEGERRKQILRRYGITPEQYDEMFTKQGGVCAACGEPSKRRLQVDHCHTTNALRGLLCFNCNSALGHAKDSVTRLQSLIAYLEGHR